MATPPLPRRGTGLSASPRSLGPNPEPPEPMARAAPKPTSAPSPEVGCPLFLAWLAGFSDGESYVDLDSTARLVWTTTHRPTLLYIQGKVGGSLRTLQFVEGSRKPRYQLAVYGTTARAVIRAMLPWLREKREQAELVLSYKPVPRGRRVPGALEQRAHIRARLKELRHAPS